MLSAVLLRGNSKRKRGNVRIFLLLLLGAAGTVARYELDGLIQHRAGSMFPFGILTVNLLDVW